MKKLRVMNALGVLSLICCSLLPLSFLARHLFMATPSTSIANHYRGQEAGGMKGDFFHGPQQQITGVARDMTQKSCQANLLSSDLYAYAEV